MGVVGFAIFGVLFLLAVLVVSESLWPARRFESVPGWRRKCLVFVPMILGISLVVPWLLVTSSRKYVLLDGRSLGTLGGTLLGVVVSELVVYWVHRLHHDSPFLWRWVHQLHHSAERVDAWGAAYFHPFEIIEGAVVGLFLFNSVMGLTPEAAALATYWQAFNGVFQHANVRTPSWLGYFIQRPEQHCIHHERGVHGYNYANLPLWDLLFGTFRNPATWQRDVGFYPGASRKIWALLLGQDISSLPQNGDHHP